MRQTYPSNSNKKTAQRFKRLAIANRGEVAVRLLQSCQELGIETILLHSEVDRKSRAGRLAHQKVCIGNGNTASESYLNMEAVISGAKKARADAIHPGFGFLSENPLFVRKCEEAGLSFVGPSSQSMEYLSDKVKAKALAKNLGIPTLPSYSSLSLKKSKEKESNVITALLKKASSMGFPLIVKATAGGGGRGMKILWNESMAKEKIIEAQQEALSAFGSDHLFLEKYLPKAKHVEVQVFGESNGEVLHLFERECSIQRKQQKIIEESLSPSIDSTLRKAMTENAMALIKEANYQGAATVEFLLEGKNYYFMEVNARLQVEHPVTEMLLGVDLVKAQIANASGELAFLTSENSKRKEELFSPRGHVIECRIYAENPFQDQLPSFGCIHHLHWPLGAGRRFDYGFEEGDSISLYYDSMIAKVIVQDKNRMLAIEKMRHTLSECRIFGIHCNIPLLQAILSHAHFKDGSMNTSFMQEYFPKGLDPKALETLKQKYTPLKNKIEEHLSKTSQAKTLNTNDTTNNHNHPKEKNPFYAPAPTKKPHNVRG